MIPIRWKSSAVRQMRVQFESDVYYKLVEAEREAEETNKRFSSKEILSAMKKAARGE